MCRLYIAFVLSLFIAACARGDERGAKGNAVVACASKAALEKWYGGSPVTQLTLSKKGECFPIPANWELVQSDESVPTVTVAKFIDAKTHKTVTIYTHAHFGDD